MKKNLLSLFLCFFLIFTTGCNLRDNLDSFASGVFDGLKTSANEVSSKKDSEREAHGYSPDEKNDAILLEVLAALDNRDRVALASIFIPYAMENIEDGNIEAGMDYLFSIYEGSVVEWYRLSQWGSGAVWNSEGWTYAEDSIFEYRVTTDLAYYRVVLYRFQCQNSKRNEDGLYRLAMIPDEEYFENNDYSVFSNTSVAGFYLPS